MDSFRDYSHFAGYLRRQRLLVLDIDGTLLNTLPRQHQGTNRFLERHRLETVSEEWVRDNVFPSTVPEILKIMEREWGYRFGDHAKEADRYSLDIAEAASPCDLYDGTPGFIEEMRSQGKIMALVTGCTHFEVQPSLELLAGMGHGKFWSSLVVADDVDPDFKPNPASVYRTFARLIRAGKTADELTPYVSVGDSIKDVLMPRFVKPCGGAVYLETTYPFEAAAAKHGYDRDAKMFKPGVAAPDYVFRSIREMHEASR